MTQARPATAQWTPGDITLGDLADRPLAASVPATVAEAVESLAGWMDEPMEDWQDDGRFLCLLAYREAWRTGLCLAKADPGGWLRCASLADWVAMGGTAADRSRLQEVFAAGVQRRELEMEDKT